MNSIWLLRFNLTFLCPEIVVATTYFSTGVGEFIHYLMLKTWVDKTERMFVKFKDSLSKAIA